MKLVFKVLLIIIIYGSLSVKAEEALQTIQVKDLQKLNTKQTRELLIGTVSFGYYQNGKTFRKYTIILLLCIIYDSIIITYQMCFVNTSFHRRIPP